MFREQKSSLRSLGNLVQHCATRFPGTTWQNVAGTTPANNGDIVRRWDDVTANGNHFTNANATQEPIRTAGSPDVLRFDGVNDRFTGLTHAHGYTHLLLMKANVLSSTQSFYGVDVDYRLIGNTDTNYRWRKTQGAATQDFGGGLSTTMGVACLVDASASSLAFYKNGVVVQASFDQFSPVRTIWTLGAQSDVGGNESQMDIAEIAVYSEVLSAAKILEASNLILKSNGL